MRAMIAFASLIVLATVALAQPTPIPEAKPHPVYKLPEGASFTCTEVRILRSGDHTQHAVPPDAKMAPEGDFEIAGELCVPKNATGTFPAVFFISGSGAQDRHGFTPTGPGKYLECGTWQLLDALATAGFVVLRVDDRGLGGTPVGPAGVEAKEIGYQALVSDARFCLRWLQARPEVDKKRVFLIGHSEGGLTAPLLAAEENSGVAGVVCMAGPGRNMFDITLDQVEASMKAAGQSGAVLAANLKCQREIQLAVKESREPDFSIVPKNVWNNPQIVAVKKWWREHFNVDDAALHKKLACPVLVVNGQADFQVNPERDARALAARLSQGKCNDVTLKLYADLDHLFKPCGGRPSNMQMYFEKRDVDKVFIADTVDWLKKH
ncbi:MAG: alpha/beta fold hydrolase [Planctomycetes bacterium]|nr:alpha/beta fold hydrolase [Planctomycetota bacterium]